jgi:hypothetical protein
MTVILRLDWGICTEFSDWCTKIYAHIKFGKQMASAELSIEDVRPYLAAPRLSLFDFHANPVF